MRSSGGLWMGVFCSCGCPGFVIRVVWVIREWVSSAAEPVQSI